MTDIIAPPIGERERAHGNFGPAYKTEVFSGLCLMSSSPQAVPCVVDKGKEDVLPSKTCRPLWNAPAT